MFRHRSRRRRRTCVSAQIRSSSSFFFFLSHTCLSHLIYLYPSFFIRQFKTVALSIWRFSAISKSAVSALVFVLHLPPRLRSFWWHCDSKTLQMIEFYHPEWRYKITFFVAGGVCTCTACREAVGAPCWIFKQAHLLFPLHELCTFGPCLIVEASAQSSPALWGLWLIPLKVLLLFSFVTKTKRGIGLPACVISKWLLAFEVLNARCFISFLLDFHYRPIIETFLLVCS